MSRTIHVGAMPAALSALAAGSTGSTQTGSTGGLNFLDLTAREIEKKSEQEVNALKDQMTLTQYKKYISGRLSAIRIEPTRVLDSLSVKISDAGFKAMKEDSEYEEWVMKTLEDVWSVPKNAGELNSFTTYSIGDSPEAFRISSVELNNKADQLLQKAMGTDGDESETFWERRHRHHEEYMELAQHEALLRKMRNGGVTAAELLLGGLL